MMRFRVAMRRYPGPVRLAVAAANMGTALVATHLFWRFVQHTPFLLGFGAAILSSRIGGSATGFLTVLLGVLGYASFPPPLPADAFASLLGGFAIISGTFSWLVGRRYEVEERLRSSEGRLTQAQELAHVGNWQWDISDDKVWWSDELYRIFGVERGSFQLRYRAFLELVHPEDRPVVERAVRQAVNDKELYDIEHRIVRPDGSVRVINAQGRAIVDERGQVVSLVGAVQDISERKAAEDAVRRSERRLQTIIDAEPACVKIVSPDGKLLDMNRAGLEMLGTDDISQVLGRPVIELLHPDDRDAFLDVHGQVCAGSRARLEFRLIGLNAQECWVDAHLVPFEILAQSGERQPAVLSVTSDITERKRLEEQLRQSQKMEAIGLLAGGIAHDFNNLLTAIGGYTDLVLRSLEDSDERREDLQEVVNAAQRAAALTRQLLAVSRRQILQRAVLDVNTLVRDIERLLRRTIPESIDLHVQLSLSMHAVRADRGQLEQVVLNLAINAGDAMPQGGQLRIATATVDIDEAWARRHPPMPPGRYARLTVSDSGIGMTPEVQAHLFEPFFTTKERGKGTGLGLAMVYGIVKQSGGFIWVESNVGHGTTFDVYFPVVMEPIAAAVPLPPMREAGGGNETIMLAEDDTAVRRLARDVLASQGYTVLDAQDGDEALEVVRQYRGPIHLLIADVVMPGLSGRELAARLSIDRPEIRVLYTSGHTENLMIRAGFDEGLTLLPKPFLPGDLLRKVGEILNAAT
jgi:two-component system, cell cycle sensor histidine kinase and response regulator CckA